MLKKIMSFMFVCANSYAVTYNSQGSSGPLASLTSMVGFVSSSVLQLTFIAGVIMCIAAFYQYLKHRESPQEVGIVQVLTLLVLGCVLMLMKYIPMSAV